MVLEYSIIRGYHNHLSEFLGLNIGEGFDVTISFLLPVLFPFLFFHPTPHAYTHDTCTHHTHDTNTYQRQAREVGEPGYCSHSLVAFLLGPLPEAQLPGATCVWSSLPLPSRASHSLALAPCLCWLPWTLATSQSYSQQEWAVCCQEPALYSQPLLLVPLYHQLPLISPGPPEMQPPSRS